MAKKQCLYLAILCAIAFCVGAAVGCAGSTGATCKSSETECSGVCTDTKTDPDNCGKCGKKCDSSQNCEAGSCKPKCVPKQEECNNIDDDCDGRVDNSIQPRSCSTACGTGKEICADGIFQNCDAPKPAAETCDGADNNCNGEIDEGCPCVGGRTYPCGENKGECKQGQALCTAGVLGACQGAVGPAAETCDGKDNNCNGTTDEGCDCAPGAQQDCGEDRGECEKGKQTCLATGKWGDCTGGKTPAKETCNGKDDDCNGVVDDIAENDPYEKNDTCDTARSLLQVANEGDPAVQIKDATLFPKPDVDWYKIQTTEATHLCGPGDPQCFLFTIRVATPKANLPYKVCVAAGDTCSSVGGQNYWCLTKPGASGAYELAIQIPGTCWVPDEPTFYLQVEGSGDTAYVCEPYTITYKYEYLGESCPE